MTRGIQIEPVHFSADLDLQTRLYQDVEECPGYVMQRKAFFFVPSHKVDLELRCPTRASVGYDRRTLGVLISSISVEDNTGVYEIPLCSLADDLGFYDVERSADSQWRWTNGSAQLTTGLLRDVCGPFILRLEGMFEFEDRFS